MGSILLPNRKTNLLSFEYNYFLKTLAEFVGDDSIIPLYSYVKSQGDNESYMKGMYMFKAIMSSGLLFYHVNKANFNQLMSPMIAVAFNNKKILYRVNAITIFPNMLESGLDDIVRKIMVLSSQINLNIEARGMSGVYTRIGKDNFDSIIDGFAI